MIRITTALSTEIDLEDALLDAGSRALEDLEGAHPDVCLVFASTAYGPKVIRVPTLLSQVVEADRLVGCSANGIIGGGVEVESIPAVSVSLLSLPEANFEVVHLIEQDLPNDDLGQEGWIRLIGSQPRDTTGIILLPDPFTFPTDRLLRGLDFAYPGVAKLGGLISGAPYPNGNSLFLDQMVLNEGALAIALSGNIRLETVVAQGCKPFGKVGQLTKTHNENIISIDDAPAMQFLRKQLEELTQDEASFAQQTPLFLGIAMDPLAANEPEPGDFLIRNMIGFDPVAETLAVDAEIGVGRRVQFHLRDGECSSRDLETMLRRSIARRGTDAGGNSGGALQPATPSARGALLFSCLGRGEQLYGKPNHDSDMFQRIVGRMPMSGFFCNGEIGPVRGSTYLHGYTSVFGVLHET